MSEFAFFLLKIGFLILLWIFVSGALLLLHKSNGFDNTRDIGNSEISFTNRSATKVQEDSLPLTGNEPTTVVVKTGDRKKFTTQKIRLIKPRMLIGRSPECHIKISDKYSSVRHAELLFVESEWKIQDLSSSNGTFLKGLRLPQGEAVTLSIGDIVKIGTTEIYLSQS